MNKRRKSAIAIYAIVLVLFVLISLAVPFRKTASSWIMFAFSVISVALGAGISIYAFGRSEDLMSKFYGYPLFRIGFLYTTIQLILTVVLYALGAIVDVPYWIGVIVSLLLLGLAAIGCIVSDNSRDFIEETDVKTVNATKALTSFRIDIADILDLCKDDELREPITKLVTKFKYSDPVSIEETKEIEDQIANCLMELKDILPSKDNSTVLHQIEKITNLLNSRNRICEKNK